MSDEKPPPKKNCARFDHFCHMKTASLCIDKSRQTVIFAFVSILRDPSVGFAHSLEVWKATTKTVRDNTPPPHRVITPVTHSFSAIYRGPITPLITIGSGPTVVRIFGARHGVFLAPHLCWRMLQGWRCRRCPGV